MLHKALCAKLAGQTTDTPCNVVSYVSPIMRTYVTHNDLQICMLKPSSCSDFYNIPFRLNYKTGFYVMYPRNSLQSESLTLDSCYQLIKDKISCDFNFIGTSSLGGPLVPLSTRLSALKPKTSKGSINNAGVKISKIIRPSGDSSQINVCYNRECNMQNPHGNWASMYCRLHFTVGLKTKLSAVLDSIKAAIEHEIDFESDKLQLQVVSDKADLAFEDLMPKQHTYFDGQPIDLDKFAKITFKSNYGQNDNHIGRCAPKSNPMVEDIIPLDFMAYVLGHQSLDHTLDTYFPATMPQVVILYPGTFTWHTHILRHILTHQPRMSYTTQSTTHHYRLCSMFDTLTCELLTNADNYRAVPSPCQMMSNVHGPRTMTHEDMISTSSLIVFRLTAKDRKSVV